MIEWMGYMKDNDVENHLIFVFHMSKKKQKRKETILLS